MKHLYFVLCLCILSGCSAVKEFNIETYNPAEITYPDHVDRILIVNNAVPQPEDVGYDLYILGKQQDTLRAHADSAIWDVCRTVGVNIVASDYFADVLLYDFATREDQTFLADGKMSQEKVQELCRETGTDAIISLDRVLFNMRKDVEEVAHGFLQGKIKVEVGGVMRTYLPERTMPLASVVFNDSVAFNEVSDDFELLDAYLPSPDHALRLAGSYIGANLHASFVPHWVEENRWYYTEGGSRWKEASAYAAIGKWEEAIVGWETLYNKSKKPIAKAKLASNLALAEEMVGHFDKAANWATLSRDLFKGTEGDESKNAQLLTAYAAVLTQRIQADKKLDIQFGE